MDADCDGKVTQSDWQQFFGGIFGKKHNAAAGRNSAIEFFKLLRLKHPSDDVHDSLADSFQEATQMKTSPLTPTSRGSSPKQIFISRNDFRAFFSRTIGHVEGAGGSNKEKQKGVQATNLETPIDPVSSALTIDHVFDLFTYLDANGDALVDRNEWFEGLGAVVDAGVASGGGGGGGGGSSGGSSSSSKTCKSVMMMSRSTKRSASLAIQYNGDDDDGSRTPVYCNM